MVSGTHNKVFLCILILLGIPYSLFAGLDDTQYRQYHSLVYSPVKPLELSLTYRLDVKENFSRFNKSNFEFSADYEIKNWVKLVSGYRFSTSYKSDKHRFTLGLSFKVKPENKNYQFQFRSILNYDSDYLDRDYWKMEDPELKLRLRGKFKYKISKKISVSAFSETFVTTYPGEFNFYRMRYGGDIDFSPAKSHSLALGYFYQHEFSIKKPESVQTFSLSYTYEIRKKKKKKAAK